MQHNTIEAYKKVGATAFHKYLVKETNGDALAIAEMLKQGVIENQNPQVFELLAATEDTEYLNETFLKAANIVLDICGLQEPEADTDLEIVKAPEHSYKIKSMSGFNFVKYDSVMINLDPNVTYLIGPNGAGKSVLGLDIPWFVMQGIAEKPSGGNTPLIGERFRFIGNGGASSLNEIVLYDEVKKVEIRVIRKLTKAGSELSFSAPAGIELDQKWLNNLFNIFLIAPRKFIELSSRDQALALGIDTKTWDLKIQELKEKFTDINKELSKFKNLEVVEEVAEVDVKELQAKIEAAKQEFVAAHKELQAKNRLTREAWENNNKAWDVFVLNFNNEQKALRSKVDEVYKAWSLLVAHDYAGNEVGVFHDNLKARLLPDIYAENFYSPKPTDLAFKPDDYVPAPTECVYVKELPDETVLNELQQQMVDATETNRKALLYTQYTDKLKDKELKEQGLKRNKQDQENEEAKKLEYIKAFKFPFSKLSVDDEGGLLLFGKPLKTAYFSSGELIRIIPTLVASQNPELKYVFIQEANLIDEDNLAKIEKELTEKGFQIVFEMVGKEKIVDKNCILLRNSTVVHDNSVTTA